MAKVLFTHEDYVELSDRQDLELIEGELIVSPSPIWSHQAVAGALEAELRRTLRGLGQVAHEVDIRFPGSTVRPDVTFIANDRLHIIADGEVIGAPDLVIEVLSATTAQRDRVVKRRLYEAHGVAEYWIVSVEAQTVQVITFAAESDALFGGKDRLHSLHLGIDLDLGDVFDA